MNVIPNNLNLTHGILVPLILLFVFIFVPAIVVLFFPRSSRRMMYGLLALVALFLWARLVFYTHLFFK